MTNKFSTEEYQIHGDIFQKQYLAADNVVRYYKNQAELTLEEWNREINLFQSMSVLENHPNFLIRFKENHRRNSFLKLVDPTSNDIIADVGCETGYLSEKLVKECKKLYCIDIDENLLSLARERIGANRAEFIQSDIQEIQLEDNSVDIAIGAEILEHLPDPTIGLKELMRITRPNGKVLISVPNEPFILFIKKVLRTFGMSFLLRGLSPKLAIGHVHIFKRKKAREMCRGLARIEKLYYNPPFYLNIFAQLRVKSE
ncbi:MAG: class I SAM-dependent methyltransferase [Thermodesulfobacteriota bacterium]|nr:class I SAM-dependent methyltransferase [Thermodesulfobacteriota bacterium]